MCNFFFPHYLSGEPEKESRLPIAGVRKGQAE